MENSFLFTLSTISQTLAGAIGLLAAFLIYHLNQLDRSLRDHLEYLYSRYPRCENTGDICIMWESYDIKGLLQYFEEDKLEQLIKGDGLDKILHLTPARNLFKRRNILLSLAKTALILTGAVIFYSILFISFTSLLVKYCCFLLWPIIVLGLIGVCICLALYVIIIFKAIEP